MLGDRFVAKDEDKLRVKITRYANDVAKHIARRGATAEDMQYIQAEFAKDRPEVIEELNTLCGSGTYKIEFELSFSLMGGVFDIYAVFTDPKYATLYKMKT